MAKFCQTSLNSWLISRYYLRYFPRLTAIYLIFITIFELRTRPRGIFRQSSALLNTIKKTSIKVFFMTAFNLYHEFKISNTEQLLEAGWVWSLKRLVYAVKIIKINLWYANQVTLWYIRIAKLVLAFLCLKNQAP